MIKYLKFIYFKNKMRLQPIVSGIIIIAGGYSLKYFEITSNEKVYLGVIGFGVLIFLIGLVMKPRRKYY